MSSEAFAHRCDLPRFVIGREKDVENSEILRLIQQSLQMDQERNEMSRALQHHHDTYSERHIHDDGFENLELNDQEKTDTEADKGSNHQELAKMHEKNYEVCSIIGRSDRGATVSCSKCGQ